MSEFPEHEKLKKAEIECRAIGGFLDWMDEQDIVIAEYGDDKHNNGNLYLLYTPKATMIARFIGIDEGKLEAEKRAMLESFREQS